MGNQVDEQANAQETAIHQEFQQQLALLQEAGAQQKMRLEQQALQLTLEYQRKRAQEDLQMKQYNAQRDHFNAQQKFLQEMGKLQEASGAWNAAVEGQQVTAPAYTSAPPTTYAAAPTMTTYAAPPTIVRR